MRSCTVIFSRTVVALVVEGKDRAALVWWFR